MATTTHGRHSSRPPLIIIIIITALGLLAPAALALGSGPARPRRLLGLALGRRLLLLLLQGRQAGGWVWTSLKAAGNA